MSRTLYFVFPALHLVEYNANAGAYVLGVPQPTAVGGLAHAFARRVSAAMGAPYLRMPAFTYAVSQFGSFSGISLNQRQLHGTPRASAATPAPINDRIRANLDFSLIVELVVDEAFELPKREFIADLIQAQRLMAGSIFCNAPPVVVEDFAEALALLPSTAFVLCDATAKVQALLDSGETTVSAMARLFAQAPNQAYKPRYAPVISGWQALQAPEAHPKMKGGADAHAFAEPILSAGLFRSIAATRTLLAKNELDDTVLWSHQTDCNVHALRGVSPYQEETEY